ncbi:MAG: hypothetical protein GXO79_00520 [Chlorobi bacterium]|nr:hypothetical protein [Chlorobiota bacterium]
MKKINILFVLSAFILLNSCKRNKLDIDVSSVKVETKIMRFDKDIYRVNIDSIEQSILYLQDKYGRFFDLYNYKIIKIGGASEKNYSEYFIDFLTDYTVNEIMEEVEKEYTNDKDINLALNSAFKHYKYYFPDKLIPDIYTFVAGFNQSIVIDENILAIGLDKYLGKNAEIYTFMQIPKYKKRNMHREKIASDCMRAIAITEYEFNDSVDNLLNHMIYEGKIMYFVDAMIPDEPDALKIGYTQEQIEWCKKYEEEI